ncbi:MAG TPA: hypothetical protein VFC25_16560 [Verrucomicrobiae bacterium]|nr:hypothetical protein [Verrucomicrobiae bacterium]
MRALAVALALAFALPAEAAAPTSWSVEYSGGSYSYADHKNLKLEVDGSSIRILKGDTLQHTIEAGSVVTVLYDHARYHPVTGYLHSAAGNAGTGSGDFAALIGVILVIPVIVLAPFVDKQHFVTLAWKDGEVVRSATFQVKDRERNAVLAALSAATGLAWRDAPAERQQLATEIAAARSSGFTFDVDREVAVADVYLEPGKYTGLLRTRPEGPELVVLEGSASQVEDALLWTPVQIGTIPPEGATHASGGSSRKKGAHEVAQVTYRDGGDMPSIRELRVGGQTLTLPEFEAFPPAMPHAVGADGRTVAISYGQYGSATITRSDFQGEPAFRFHDVALFPHSRKGGPALDDLAISSRRVVFNPEGDPAWSLVIERSSITDVGNGPLNTQTGLGLTTSEKTYTFTLHAPGRKAAMHPKRQSLVLTRIADFARLAVRDFDAANVLFDDWLAGIPTLPPTGTPGETAAPEETDAATP